MNNLALFFEQFEVVVVLSPVFSKWSKVLRVALFVYWEECQFGMTA